LKSVAEWPLLLFLFIILYPINLYVLAHLLFPSHEGGFDTQEFYSSNYRKIFLWACPLPLLSIVQNLTVSHYTLVDQIGQISVLVLLLVMVVVRPVRTLTHLIICLLLLALLLTSLFYSQPISA
jgi:hypothetical protein